MSNIGRYKVPSELKDEDKWFRFFTKKHLAAIAVVAFIDFQIVALSFKLHIVIVGIILALFIAIVAAIIIPFNVPAHMHLHGGGQAISTIALRIMRRKLIPRNKVIYTYTGDKEVEP